MVQVDWKHRAVVTNCRRCHQTLVGRDKIELEQDASACGRGNKGLGLKTSSRIARSSALLLPSDLSRYVNHHSKTKDLISYLQNAIAHFKQYFKNALIELMCIKRID